MIAVEGLTRRFGAATALDDVSFRVSPGEVVGFLGPNGAGKTTAMRILTCTLPPSAGRAEVAGHDVGVASLEVRRRVGFMPENTPLYPDCTVREHLRFVGRLKRPGQRGLEAQLASIEERTGLAEVRDRLVGQLSKGYRQRVGLAQALVGDPPILILDEPTAGLDPHQIVEIRDLIRAFRGEKTVLLSSHILSEVALTCERVLILHRGRLAGEADTERLDAGAPGLARLLVAWDGERAAVHAALAGVAGVVAVTPAPGGAEVVCAGDPAEVRPRLAAALIAAGGRLQQMSDRPGTLEELFLRVTGGEGAPPPGSGAG